MSSTPTVNCPQCGKSSTYDTKNRFRPFCSERCKMIDLGAWANEDYRVPGPPKDDRNKLEPPNDQAD
jgi:uncharacterized protein